MARRKSTRPGRGGAPRRAGPHRSGVSGPPAPPDGPAGLGAPDADPDQPAVPDPEDPWSTRHLWEIQPIRDILVLAGVFGVLYLGYVLSVVTVPILVAMALAYLCEPLVRRVARLPFMNRARTAAAFIFGASLLVLVPAVLAVAFAIAQAKNLAVQGLRLLDSAQVASPADAADEVVRTEEASAVYERMPKRWKLVSDALVRLESQLARRQAGADAEPGRMFQSEALTLLDLVAQWLKVQVPAIGATAVSKTGGAVQIAYQSAVSLGTFLFGVFLTAFFFFFFCTGYGEVLRFWEGLIPERRKGRVIELLDKMDLVIAGFVRGRVLVGVVLAVFYTVAYALIGVPASLLLGPLVGLTQIVPYVSMIGVPISIVLMWLEPERALMFGQSWWYPIAAPMVVYVLGQMLDDYVLSPVIQGEATDMDVPSILFASLAGGILAGVYGLLLAIPAAACAKILLREVFWPRFRAWAEGRERDILPIEG